ncbi:PREDICTED: uncharacterized protein LOC106750588 [Dinoponera quadriceps]|uniref:Uncharacterized protein LOC106750588 n=1 Tax=Dinoponera quadriceps TaxID=609295 RepID=A0A6P3Y820_DINQU|nr:PREDICTED: uncharacterized protein LOC106750588 [Dinoponera quadriceps]
MSIAAIPRREHCFWRMDCPNVFYYEYNITPFNFSSFARYEPLSRVIEPCREHLRVPRDLLENCAVRVKRDTETLKSFSKSCTDVIERTKRSLRIGKKLLDGIKMDVEISKFVTSDTEYAHIRERIAENIEELRSVGANCAVSRFYDDGNDDSCGGEVVANDDYDDDDDDEATTTAATWRQR